jgi:hypothetical protein
MRTSLLIICLCVAIPYAGRADQPTAATVAATPAPAAVTAASAESVPVTMDPPAVEKTPEQLKKEAAEAKIKQYGVNGYKPETTKAGDILYCKRETAVGTRFETKQCRTFDQLRDEALRGKEYLEQMQHVIPPNKG